MANLAPSKPDLAAHEAATRLGIDAVVAELRQLLGVRLVAYIAGASETRAVHQWASGSREIRDHEVADRLRLVYQVTQLLVSRDSGKVPRRGSRASIQSSTTTLPARLLREGKLAEVGRQVLAAAKAFAALG